MFTHELKSVVFKGVLRPTQKAARSAPDGGGQDSNAAPGEAASSSAAPGNAASELTLVGERERPLLYNILSQSSDDLRDQENSPSISMWPYLLASAQTQRLNEISIYAEQGTTADKMRFLYMNDFALHIWSEMQKRTEVMGRLHRPPRGATLSFGMPFYD